MDYKRFGAYLDECVDIRNGEGKRLNDVSEHTTACLNSGLYTKESIEIYLKTCVDKLFRIKSGMFTFEIEKDTMNYVILDGIRIVKDYSGTFSIRCYVPLTGNYEEVEVGMLKTKAQLKKDLLHFFNSSIEKFELNVYSRYA